MKREEAINIVRKNIPHLGIGAAEMTEALNELIPELRESEDERIRKEIISAFEFWFKEGVTIIPKEKGGRITVEQAIDYLERQKEQKPTPNWMPKFLDELRSKKNYFDWDEHRDIEGHILAIINWIAPDYFDRKEKEQKPIEFKNDELVEIIKGEFEGFRTLLKKKGIDYEPQRGYWEGFARLFDSSAREYVKEQKEQKPDDLSLDKLVEFFEKTAKQYDIDLPHRGYDIYHLCKDLYNFIYTFLPIPEQKPAEWSDEDEKMLWSVINGLHSGMYDKEREWLANRFKYLRPKSKVDSVEYERGFLAGQGSVQHWKPTDEQMDVLLSTIKDKHNAARFYSLSSLYNDLKKL